MTNTQNRINENTQTVCEHTIRASLGAIEAISIISMRLEEVCLATHEKVVWEESASIWVDFSQIGGCTIVDLDIRISQDKALAISEAIAELHDLEIPFSFKLYGITYSAYDVQDIYEEEGLYDVRGFVEHFEDSPQKIWFEEYKDKMDYEKFKKQHPELFV